MRIVCVSDTHGRHTQVTVPDGDVLVFAGDFMTDGRNVLEIIQFLRWLRSQPHKHKVVIAGNHDRLLEEAPGLFRPWLEKDCHYLQDTGCEIEGVKFWGSPYQPEFSNWAFNKERGLPIRQHWKLIPDDTDVLITHGPAHGILDQSGRGFEHLGCEELMDVIDNRLQLQLHVCGHIHGGYGRVTKRRTTFVNASVLNESYHLQNEPIIVDI